jgi:hypothetical protein
MEFLHHDLFVKYTGIYVLYLLLLFVFSRPSEAEIKYKYNKVNVKS